MNVNEENIENYIVHCIIYYYNSREEHKRCFDITLYNYMLFKW